MNVRVSASKFNLIADYTTSLINRTIDNPDSWNFSKSSNDILKKTQFHCWIPLPAEFSQALFNFTISTRALIIILIFSYRSSAS